MKALLYERFGQVPQLREVPDPGCPPDGAVVRVEATGLCRSDWHALMGHDPEVVLPHVPGHEFAGRVERVGEQVRGWTPGQRVTACFVNACGRCEQCLAGQHQVCPRQTQPGFSRWGSFAELVVVDRAEVNLVELPDGVNAVTAAALGCRLATAYRAVRQVGAVGLGHWVAVHGCGGVGLSAVMVARAAGAHVVAVDVAPAPLELARRMGARAVVRVPPGADPLPVAAQVRQAVLDAGGPGGVDLSLDAFGGAATCAASIACLRPRGRHVQVGLLPPALGWPQLPMHLVVAHELQVLGSHGLAVGDYEGLLALVAAGALRPEELVGRVIELPDAGAALAAMGEGSGPAGVTVALPDGSGPP